MLAIKPIIIDFGRSFLGFLSSPAIFPTLIQPSYAHKVPNIAAPNPVAPTEVDATAGIAKSCAVPFSNPYTIITNIGISFPNVANHLNLASKLCG